MHESTENLRITHFKLLFGLSYFQAASIYSKSQAKRLLEKFGLNPLPGDEMFLHGFLHLSVVSIIRPMKGNAVWGMNVLLNGLNG